MDSLPHDDEAEEALIACALVGGDTVAWELTAAVEPGDFYNRQRQAIWRTISDLLIRGEHVNQVTVAYDLSRAHTLAPHETDLEVVGGQLKLSEMVFSTPTAVGGEWWAGLVKRAAYRREVVTKAHAVAKAALEDTEAVEDAVNTEILSLLSVGQKTRHQRDYSASQLANDTGDYIAFLENPSAITGLRTPWAALNGYLSGLHPSELVVVTAGTSVGKSLFVQQILADLALGDVPVVLATGEMSAKQAMQRMAFQVARVNPQFGRQSGSFADSQKAAVLNALGALAEAPLMITEEMSLTGIIARARRLCAIGRCRVLAVDHLQHVSVESGRNENRVNEVDRISKSLMQLAHDERITVLAISHVNRNGEARWSGSIEQDANTHLHLRPVAMAHELMVPGSGYVELDRDQLRDWRRSHTYVDVELQIQKQRNGITGSFIVRQNWAEGGNYREVES